jgi:GH25 family lysozyme M1 (1,4-beta-N-acetylmuramidase)
MKIGVDFSKWQGTVSYQELLTNIPKIEFVIIRSSEGSTNADPKFIENVKGAQKFGFPTECYHFCTWDNNNEVVDSTGEAKFLIQCLHMASLPLTTKIWIDTESNKSNIILSREQMRTYINTFIDVLKQNGFNNYGLYAGKGFVTAFYPQPNPFGNIDLWVSSYNGKDKPTMPPGWAKWHTWQKTDSAIVKGVKTKCDLNFRP